MYLEKERKRKAETIDNLFIYFNILQYPTIASIHSNELEHVGACWSIRHEQT